MAATTGHDRHHARHPFLDEVLRTPIQDLIRIRSLFILESGNSIRQALNVLGTHHVLSAPIINPSGSVFGFIDYLDIVSYLIQKSDGEIQNAIEHLGDRLDSVAGQSMRNPFVHLFGRTAAIVLTEIFASGVHRCAVFDDDLKISSIITQSDIVRFIRKQLKFPQMAEFFACTAAEAGWGSRKVITVVGRVPVTEVVMMMEASKVYAIGIIGERGELLGNFSLSDLCGVNEKNMHQLLLPVADYLRDRHPGALNVFSCTKFSKVGDIIETLADEELHRLWVVNEAFQPIGLVTLTDVMNLALNFAPKRQKHVLELPGFLQVSILGARNLSSSSWLSRPYVICQIPGIKQAQFVTPISESVNEAIWVNQAFTVNLEESIAQDMILFMVKGSKFYGTDEDLGYLIVSFEWVLSGFGSGVHCMAVQDWFSLKSRDSGQPTLGQIQLAFKYSTVIPAS